ncbi:MAG: T9SS type A sorting domain-containing protein [Rhodothermales bacterium]|nr:T9SS type A sorting domain-containing protein [Rhodothermales bacterium]MBO6779704.1 T9SS type A sorting domain-containing protein [Rhodothermales bacterium]
MNGVTKAARLRVADTFSSAARSLIFLLGLMFSVSVASAQTVGFSVSTDGPAGSVGRRTTLNEGASKTAYVELSGGGTLGANATVDYVAQAGTCTATPVVNDATLNADYPLISGQLTFPKNSGAGVKRPISVQTLDDAIRENATNGGYECFEIKLFNPVGFSLNANDALTVFILDDEANPSVSISDASILEGGSAALTLSLSHLSDEAIVFDTQTTANLAFLVGNTENGAGAAEDVDFYDGDATANAMTFASAAEFGSTISAMSASSVLYVPTWPDNIYEGDELFSVQLLVPGGANYTVSDAIGAVTIEDDEDVPTVIMVQDESGLETAGSFTFKARPSHHSEQAYNVQIAYLDVTALKNQDYTPGPASINVAGVSFGNPAIVDEMIPVSIIDDQIPEDGEIFVVQLQNGTGYNIDDETAAGYITDDDGVDLTIVATSTTGTVNDASVALIGGAPAVVYEFTVTNNGAAAATDVVIDYQLIGLSKTTQSGCGGSVSAVVDGAFTCGGGGAVTIGAGSSRVYTVTTSVTAAHGDHASIEALVQDQGAGSVETNPGDNEDRVITAVYGADFGDRIAAGSHVMSDDLTLGVLRDAETSVTGSLAADTDDTTGEADEDGVGFPLPGGLIQRGGAGAPVENLLPVTLSHDGYLSVFAEYDDGLAGVVWTTEVDDLPVSSGLNWVSIDVDELTGVATPGTLLTLRFRACTVQDVCDSPTTGAVAGGEMEDYSVTTQFRSAAKTFQMPEGVVEPVRVEFTATDILLVDGNGTIIFTNDLVAIGTGATTDFLIEGNSGPNSFVVDIEMMPSGFDLDVDGKLGDDALVLVDESGTVHTTVNHTALNASDGDVEISGGYTIRFRDFAPVQDNLSAANREFEFSDLIDDNIVIRDNGADADGFTFIDSNGSEEITFKNPTTTLKVWAGLGSDSYAFEGVDETDGNGNPASFEISLYGDDVAEGITDGPDHFLIAPLTTTSSLTFGDIEGGLPSTCVGDVLDIDTSLGAVIDTIDEAGKQISFSSSHQLLTFDEMEHFADYVADVKLSLILPPTPSTNPGDILPVELLVENLGPNTADCIKINDTLLDGALTILDGPTFTQGSFNSPMWLVGSLAPGATATLSYTVEVGYQYNGEATITALAPQEDPNLHNNSVSLDIEPAFPFPVKAQATAALWYDHDGDPDTDKRLIVGLANGFAGLNSAVLCRVPNFDGVFSDDYPLWRECGAGLPYPLYVTDLAHVETTDPDDRDLIYLTAWGSDGLYVSRDGGESFTAVNPGVSDTHVAGWTAVYAFTEDADGFLYISTNHGFVYRSLNGGETWQKIGDLPEVDADTPWSLVAHPRESGRLYAGTFGRGIYTSEDYGFTWEFLGGQAVNDLLIANRGGHAFDLELDPTNDFIFVGTGNGVFRMSLAGDGSSTGLWQSLDMEVTLNNGDVVTPEVRALAFDMNGHLYATTWGFGAFRNPAPTLTPSVDFVKIALRGQEVAFVAISEDGQDIAFGSMEGGIEFGEPLAASATSTEDEPVDAELPSGYVLEQNYPNPFNPVTTIGFALPQSGQVRLAVYDVLGREVALLVDGSVQAGQHSVQFDAQGLTTGTYIYRLQTESGAYARQLVLMK